MSLLSLEQAQQRLLALAPQMGEEQVALDDALGRVLTRDLESRVKRPAADLSAMDGYALAGDGPWCCVGESRAGAPFDQRIDAGETVRISTGARLPDGADRILIKEHAHIDGDAVAATEMPTAGQYIRRQGSDFEQGASVLRRGTTIGPAQIALAMAAGHATIAVAKRPRIGVLDSGDELVRDPENCGDNQIPASNGAMIAAMLHPLVGSTENLGAVPDDRAALSRALSDAEGLDIIITSGGASVGDHDHVQQALRDWGASIDFWKVAMKPGKPMMVATRRSGDISQVIIGLPGNPVSSFVTAFMFALPLVRAAMGVPSPLPHRIATIAGVSLPATATRQEFLRGIFDGKMAIPLFSQDSSALLALASANCLIERPVRSPAIAAGDPIDVFCIRNG